MYRLSPDNTLHCKTLNRNLRKRARSSLELISPKRHQGIAMPQTYTNEELWRLVLQEHGQAWRPDLERPARNRTFPIEVNHPLLVGPGPKWETLRLKLLEILHKSNVEWSSISVLRRRPTIQPIYDDDTTVVVVIGQDTTSNAEDHLCQGLHTTCRDEGHPTLRIELLRGKAILFTDVPGPSYQRKPDIGSSLGVRDNNCSAGTLGGFVKLRKNGDILSCALTCHHVLKPASPNSADSTQQSTAPTPLPSSETGEAIEVDQPALMDHLELRSTLSDQVEVCEKQIKAITYKPNNGFDPEEVQPRLELLRKKHQAYADHKRLIESADRRFGRVWETSGYLVTPEGFLLDWGVFLVNEDRLGLNLVSQVSIICVLNFSWTNHISSLLSVRISTELMVQLSPLSKD